jgi:ribosomal protein S18 acetylase RimI-like enzyme
VKIDLLSGEAVTARLPELGGLLADAVQHGASVGFVLPLAGGEVEAYWRTVGAEVSVGRKLLLAAFDEGGRLVGSAQLALEPRANGRHRAEVQKVLVLAAHRRRALGAALMARVEVEARVRDRTLLFLDTSVGAGGVTEFYERLGYTLAGGIPDFAADPDGRLAPNAIYYKRLDASTPGAL